jgi:hypothetical protein
MILGVFVGTPNRIAVIAVQRLALLATMRSNLRVILAVPAGSVHRRSRGSIHLVNINHAVDRKRSTN